MKDLCKKMAGILKKQGGNAYGFGDDPDSPDLVTKQMDSEDLKKAPTHTKSIENLFGVKDAILTRFGGQAFKKSV